MGCVVSSGLFPWLVCCLCLGCGRVSLGILRLLWGPLASCIVLDCLLGFALLEIKSYLSKKKKAYSSSHQLVVHT